MSTLKVNTLQNTSGNTLTFIKQVVQTVKTDTASSSSSNTDNFVDCPGMSVNITPSSASSKILVQFTFNGGASPGTLHLRLLRGSTSIFQGDAEGDRFGSTLINRTAGTPYVLEIAALNATFLDSPSSTSALTYKLQWTAGASYSTTLYLNRATNNDNEDYVGRTASSITVMEVAA